MPNSKPKTYETKKPKRYQANFLLFSMHGIPGINAYLENFPKDMSGSGVSATLLWSGNAGFNVPVTTFEAKHRITGFVLDPNNLQIPQADLIAYKSEGMLQKEYKKDKGPTGNNTPNESKYQNKYGYLRTMGFTTNLARHERIKEGVSVYHDTGSAETLSRNIWHKSRKNKRPDNQHTTDSQEVMKFNEAIVFQSGEVNPITGLFLIAKPDQQTANNLKEILTKRRSLKLYLYDSTAQEHIVRCLDNAAARKYLGSRNLDFSRAFASATPFVGEKINYKFFVTEPNKGRWHLFKASIIYDSNSTVLDGSIFQFTHFNGDYLKTRILDLLLDKIKKISTPEKLSQFRKDLPNSTEFKVLAKGQGLTTRLFRLNTSSVKALEEMLNKREEELKGPSVVKKI